MTERPLILITNDDSITAKGIAQLVASMRSLGDLIVVAPIKPQSGMGHAITINKPLRLNRMEMFEGVESYTCSGTPVDCVKLGVYELIKKRPALLVSGINHGSNAATNVLYSGTMSAAVEGAIEGIPSIGFSLLDHSLDADFEAAGAYAKLIAEGVLKNGLPSGVCLNVNIPKGKLNELNGVKICRQGRAFWEDSFDKRKDPFGQDYFWLTGNFSAIDKGDDTDLHALDQNYVTIVPTQFDMTSHVLIEDLNNWNLSL